eukprot:3299601-Pyramimonas_sp.AAC.1
MDARRVRIMACEPYRAGVVLDQGKAVAHDPLEPFLHSTGLAAANPLVRIQTRKTFISGRGPRPADDAEGA